MGLIEGFIFSCLASNLQVLVPCCGSFSVSSFSDSYFDSYVLQPAEDGYKTLDGKVCFITPPHSIGGPESSSQFGGSFQRFYVLLFSPSRKLRCCDHN